MAGLRRINVDELKAFLIAIYKSLINNIGRDFLFTGHRNFSNNEDQHFINATVARC
jgi:hypothetical protein